MTPQEVQRTMDFILRSQADSIIRMEQWEEKFEKELEGVKETIAAVKETIAETASENRKTAKLIRQNAAAMRDREKENRAYEKRMRALEASDRRNRKRVEGIKDLLRLFNERQDLHSKRLDRLERRNA